MLKFLSVTRRILLVGVCSLVIIIFLYVSGYSGTDFSNVDMIGSIYLCFACASPILGFLMWVISSFYVRKKGQSAAYQSQLKFGTTMIQMLGSDISSPFRLLKEQFTARKRLVDYYSTIAQSEIAGMLADGSKAINRLRLIRMIIRFIIYIIGIISAVYVLRNMP